MYIFNKLIVDDDRSQQLQNILLSRRQILMSESVFFKIFSKLHNFSIDKGVEEYLVSPQ